MEEELLVQGHPQEWKVYFPPHLPNVRIGFLGFHIEDMDCLLNLVTVDVRPLVQNATSGDTTLTLSSLPMRK